MADFIDRGHQASVRAACAEDREGVGVGDRASGRVHASADFRGRFEILEGHHGFRLSRFGGRAIYSGVRSEGKRNLRRDPR